MGHIIRDTDMCKPGDVLLVAIQLTDKQTGQPFWWKSFRCVMRVTSSRFATLLHLKMHPDLDKDVREVDFHEGAGNHMGEGVRQVIEWLPEEAWPQGVVAMRMKQIALGVLDLTPF